MVGLDLRLLPHHVCLVGPGAQPSPTVCFGECEPKFASGLLSLCTMEPRIAERHAEMAWKGAHLWQQRHLDDRQHERGFERF